MIYCDIYKKILQNVNNLKYYNKLYDLDNIMLEVNSLLLACLDRGVKEGDLVLCRIQPKVALQQIGHADHLCSALCSAQSQIS